MHYIIVILIIVVIVLIQFNSYFSNKRRMNIFKNVFPAKNELKNLIEKVENAYKNKIQTIEKSNDYQLEELLRKEGINVENFYKTKTSYLLTMGREYKPWENQEKTLEKTKAQTRLKDLAKKERDDEIVNVRSLFKESQNEIFTTIENSIQDYVQANKGGVSDFHLMKDIVDRNCDAKEEEIQTQIPVPLYLGLVGTMAGILVGILYLWLSGGLSDLLNSGSGNNNAADGVEALLGGVALAMISSICGILLTTIGSWKFKTAKNILEIGKHAYLSKIQTELLPSLSNDVSSSLVKMSQNLQNFNSTFSENTREFGAVLNTVNKATADVAKTLTAIQNLDMNKIAGANIDVYNALRNCTDEIGKLGEYLQGINQYQANTTQAIEDMHKFFASGIEQVDSINIGVKNALERFAEGAQTYLNRLQEKLDGQILNVSDASEKQQQALQSHFDNLITTLTTALTLQQEELLKHFSTVSVQMQTAAGEQQKIFAEKLTQMNVLVDELKNLSAVKTSMKDLVSATNDQKRELSNLSKQIEKLAETKTIGGKLPTPRSTKVAAIAGGGIVSAAGLAYLIPQLVKWISELIKLL